MKDEIIRFILNNPYPLFEEIYTCVKLRKRADWLTRLRYFLVTGRRLGDV